MFLQHGKNRLAPAVAYKKAAHAAFCAVLFRLPPQIMRGKCGAAEGDKITRYIYE